MSKFKNTKASTTFRTISSRRELWGPALPQPDFINEKKQENLWQPKNLIPFDPKINGHLPINPAKPFRVPDGYSYETLRKGFEATTRLKKPKALVDMAHSPSRDNVMYEHLDADYIKLVKKERR